MVTKKHFKGVINNVILVLRDIFTPFFNHSRCSLTLKGTLQRALGEPQGAFEQGTGKEGTIHLEEYFVQKQIRLVDTRGFFESDEKLFEECLNIMSGRYGIDVNLQA